MPVSLARTTFPSVIRGLGIAVAVLVLSGCGPAAAAEGPVPESAGLDVGWSRLVAGDAVEAEAIFRGILDDDAASAEAHRGLGEALRARGDREGAIAAFRRSLALAPHPDARRSLAEIYAEDPATRAEARTLLSAGIADDPGDWAARLTLAGILAGAGHRDEATREYDAILAAPEAAPYHARARLARAELRSWEGDLDAARSDYAEVATTDPGGARARLGLAEVALWEGRHLRAHRGFRAALTASLSDTDRARALLGEGRVQLATHRYQVADPLLAEAEALAPTHPEPPRWRQRLALTRAPRLDVGVDVVDDANDLRRRTLYASGRVVVGAIPVRVGVRHTRYEAGDVDELDRITIPVSVVWPATVRTRFEAGAAAHLHDDDAVDDAIAAHLSATHLLTETTEVRVLAARHELVDRALPDDLTYYSQSGDLAAIRDGVHVHRVDLRVTQGLARRVGLIGEVSVAEVDDDNGRIEGYLEANLRPRSGLGLLLRGFGYHVAYDEDDPRYFSPDAYTLVGLAFRLDVPIGIARVGTAHAILLDLDETDDPGREHELEVTVPVGGRVSAMGSYRYFEAPASRDPAGGTGDFWIEGFRLGLTVRWP